MPASTGNGIMRRKEETSQQLLLDASALLTASLDYEETLTSLATLVARRVADMCVVDIIEPQRGFRRLVAEHRDPAMGGLCAELMSLSLDVDHTLGRAAIESRKPVLFPDIRSKLVEEIAKCPEHLRILRALRIKSAVCVPLLSHDLAIGALVLASSEADAFTADDVALAIQLAERAAISLERAWLYSAAMRAVRARDEVVAIVAHDLRGFLNTISLAIGIFRGQPSVERQARSILSIERACARANRLLSDLLDVTRIEAGRMPVEPKPVPSRDLLLEALDIEELLATAREIELRTEIPSNAPVLLADRERILQVLDNLVGNAIKFTPRGGHITLAVKRLEDRAALCVADDGPGIAPEVLPHIFDRFWQAAKREERNGAGLGLAICKGIVEAHGGRIWAESSGLGTTISFVLPLAA